MFGGNALFYLAPPIIAILALIVAFQKASWVSKQDPGDDRMKMIAGWWKKKKG